MSAAVDLAALVSARRKARERIQSAGWAVDIAASQHDVLRALGVTEEAVARADIAAAEHEAATLTMAIGVELNRIATVQLAAENRMRAEVEADPALASGDSLAHRRLQAVTEAQPACVSFTIHFDWTDRQLHAHRVLGVEAHIPDGDRVLVGSLSKGLPS